MRRDETGFAEFFRASWDPCLRAVAASTGDVPRAEEQVAEAFARAWASWRKVSRRRIVSMGTGRRKTITIDPRAIGDGTELSFGGFRVGSAQAALVALIRTGHFACTTTMPTDSPGGSPRLGYLRLPPRQATSRG